MCNLPSRCILFLGVFSILLILSMVGPAGAQGLPPLTGRDGSFIPSSPGTATPMLMPAPPPGAPGGAYGAQRGSDIIPLSSGMFSGIMPRIPNLEFGFLYNFGNNVRMGRFTADYVLPFSLSCDSVLFGEAHGEWEDFWKTPTVSVTSVAGSTVTTSGSSNRVDLSFGGGYRTMLGESTLLGVNGFYDASRLFDTWYSSGGVGLEWAALIGGDAAIDLNVNWYGNLFTRDGLINAFRNRGGSYDIEAGYSQSLFNQAVDLRLKATGYQFDIGSAVYGWRTGADLTTRDGVFSLRYEYGRDGINGSYNTVGGFVNVGFQLENLLSGESPFTAPEPVFKSPRNLRRWLTTKVHRNWHQPSAVVVARQVQNLTGGAGGCDRVIAPFPLNVVVPGAVFANNIAFPLFPFGSLNPTGVIKLTLTFASPVPLGEVVAVAVIGDNNVTDNTGFFIGTGTATTATITLTPTQNAFILAGTNPNHLTVTEVGASNIGVLSACINFNQ
jgi:hypothetical protein